MRNLVGVELAGMHVGTQDSCIYSFLLLEEIVTLPTSYHERGDDDNFALFKALLLSSEFSPTRVGASLGRTQGAPTPTN